MPWDEYTLEQFQTTLPLGEYDESRYYGPYNGLLSDLFPKQEHYMVVPQYKRLTQLTSVDVDFTTIFLVQQREHPVFFLEIKAAGHIHRTSSRAAADNQMREMVGNLCDDVKIPILYGVSAIGTKLCFYKYTKDTGKLEPALIPGHTKVVVDTAPRDRWEFDVLTHEGEQKLRDVIGDVKRMCTQLGP
ncbi:hypothetical protein BDZ91DRAFT_737655 [Kalaharituber pfeilii]|nr:hypothetical protein BDZ91DRAFT_737655 [Kalaharituber pfeilii]